MAKVSLVVLHFNKPELTKACLESVRQLETKNFKFEVIVINNNPLEKIDFLKKEFPKFTFLKTSKNLGYAGGNNFGIKRALEGGADFALILNNDTFLDKDLIAELLKTAKADAKIGILAPKIYFAPGCEFHHQRYQKTMIILTR